MLSYIIIRRDYRLDNDVQDRQLRDMPLSSTNGCQKKFARILEDSSEELSSQVKAHNRYSARLRFFYEKTFFSRVKPSLSAHDTQSYAPM